MEQIGEQQGVLPVAGGDVQLGAHPPAGAGVDLRADAQGGHGQGGPVTTSVLTEPIAQDTVKDLLKSASSDLLFLWNRHSIPEQVQARLIEQGFAETEVWAKVGDSAAGVRKYIREESGINRQGAAGYMGLVARLIATWESAQIRGE